MSDSLWLNLWWAFWIFLPAGVANMSPVFANHIPGLKNWKTPLDLHLNYRGKRLLGDNKTWRGVVFGSAMAAVVAVAEFAIIAHSNYSAEHAWLVALAGGLMGLGALTGDAVESFLKRRAGVNAGDSWFPFDQTDYIIGGLLLSYPLVRWPLEIVLLIFAMYFGLHIVVSYIGYLLGLKEKAI